MPTEPPHAAAVVTPQFLIEPNGSGLTNEPIDGQSCPAVSGARPPGYDLDLVVIEGKVPGKMNTWRLTGAGLRRGNDEWWLVPPGGSFEYWWEKDSNGYSYAVFHYYVSSEHGSAARGVAQARARGRRDPLPNSFVAPSQGLTTRSWPARICGADRRQLACGRRRRRRRGPRARRR